GTASSSRLAVFCRHRNRPYPKASRESCSRAFRVLCLPASGNLELLLQARGRGCVLEKELLVGVDVAMHLLGRERRLVKTGQDQLQLAGIMIDVADRENSGC